MNYLMHDFKSRLAMHFDRLKVKIGFWSAKASADKNTFSSRLLSLDNEKQCYYRGQLVHPPVIWPECWSFSGQNGAAKNAAAPSY